MVDNISGFLSKLNKLGVYLTVRDGRLISRSGAGVITASIAKDIQQNKEKIIEYINSNICKNFVYEKPRHQDTVLSSAQKRMWFLHHLEPHKAIYNETKALKLIGNVNLTAIRNALKFIVDRNKILRTCYFDNQGIEGKLLESNSFDVVDASRSLAEAVEFHQQTVFDLSKDFMLRAEFVVEGDHRLLVVCFHHIAVDGWSYNLLVNELVQLYELGVQNKNLSLEKSFIEYSDYAAWQVKQNYLKELKYWEDRLLDLPQSHGLPLDSSLPGSGLRNCGTLKQTISLEITEQIVSFARNCNVTTFMFLHAAFACLLFRYSAESDTVIGTPVANRENHDTANVIGLFVNTLVIRTLVDGNQQFVQFLNTVKEELLNAYQNQNIPFEKLVEALKPQRELNRNPLFQIMIVYQNNLSRERFVGEVCFKQYDLDSLFCKVDLALEIEEVDGAICLKFEFDSDRFSQTTMVGMMEHFKILLRGILNNPNSIIGELPLLTETEIHEQLVVRNGTLIKYAKNEFIHDLFERHANRNSDNVAVKFGNTQLTYGQLNGKANQLAHYLIEEQLVRSDSFVGVYLNRSAELVIAVLAVMKAGGVYVPIDPVLSEGRLNDISDFLGCSALLTDSDLCLRLHDFRGETILIDDLLTRRTLQQRPILSPFPNDLSESSLAYVLFTSGSTGKPKAIGMPHGALINLVNGLVRHAPILGEQHKLLQFASIGFDMSFTDLALAFVGGGEVVMIDSSTQHNVEDLIRTIKRECITLLNLPYAVLQLICDYCVRHSIDMPSVKVIISTAERLKITSAIREYFTRNSRCQLINHYGPSETHVVTAATLMGESKFWPEYPSVGRPIGNVRCYILNDQLQLVPEGVVGQLYIGGDCLARGYVGAPDLTAEKFISDPFYPVTESLMYNTGDLVRWSVGKDIEYIGRADSQVKVRGFRVELSEIECAILKFEGVRDVMVLSNRTSESELEILIAYLVIEKSEIFSFELENTLSAGLNTYISNLRHHLYKTLPNYMVPSSFVFLEQFPLTHNGKVDRNLLPTAEVLVDQSYYVSPSTEIEKVLCQIWQEVLNLERVGIADNFFQLGGHSLLAMELLTKINISLGIKLPLKVLFSDATVLGVAQTIESVRQHNLNSMVLEERDVVAQGFL